MHDRNNSLNRHRSPYSSAAAHCAGLPPALGAATARVDIRRSSGKSPPRRSLRESASAPLAPRGRGYKESGAFGICHCLSGSPPDDSVGVDRCRLISSCRMLSEKAPAPSCLDGLKRLAIDTGSTAIAFGDAVRFMQGFKLRHVDEEPPEAMRRFRLRLAVYPSSQLLQTDGCLYHLTPPSLERLECSSVRVLPSWRVLLHADPSVLRPDPPPWCRSPPLPTHGYRERLLGGISSPGTEGFSS